MPIYDMECKKCNTRVELIAAHEETIRCRKCDKIMKRLPPLSNFRLKGNCWCTDNYRGLSNIKGNGKKGGVI